MRMLEIIAVMAIMLLGFAFIASYKSRDRAMALLVGVSAGLVGIQVVRVHIFTILVILWCLQPNVSTNSGSGKRIATLSAASLLLAITAIFGDLVVSPTLALQLIGLTASACLIIARASLRDRHDMINGLLAVVSASSMLGLLQVMKIAPIEIWHEHVSSVGRPIGLYSEPDWLGMFAGLGVIMAWRLPMRPAWKALLISVNLAALIFAFARAAWVGVGAAIVLLIIAGLILKKPESTKNTKSRGKWPAIAFVTAFGACFLAANPSFASDFLRRLQGTFAVSSDGDDISGQARVRQINGLIDLASTGPWYGHGLSANGRVGIWGDVNLGDAANSTNAVNSNWLLAMWVDGRILSIPLILTLIMIAVYTCRSISGQMLTVVLVSSMFSNATFQPITWLLLALAFSSAWDNKNSMPIADQQSKTLTLDPTPMALRRPPNLQ